MGTRGAPVGTRGSWILARWLQHSAHSRGRVRAPPVHPCQRNRVPCSGERACSPSRTRPIKASDSRSLRIHADSLLRSPEFCAHTCVRCGILLVSAGFLQIQALSLRLSAESTTVCELVHRSRCTNSHAPEDSEILGRDEAESGMDTGSVSPEVARSRRNGLQSGPRPTNCPDQHPPAARSRVRITPPARLHHILWAYSIALCRWCSLTGSITRKPARITRTIPRMPQYWVASMPVVHAPIPMNSVYMNGARNEITRPVVA